ncbi:uncharacterized protein G2W53_021382 [Senna tora]|uniref:Uncharacterized protein n=1 Tax=Senna tora TaxID=362788 RepID=A0A834TJG7_9FABA|nr:uncharacterized protein G2W53_021382 [Senna tora]
MDDSVDAANDSTVSCDECSDSTIVSDCEVVANYFNNANISDLNNANISDLNCRKWDFLISQRSLFIALNCYPTADKLKGREKMDHQIQAHHLDALYMY